MKKDLHLHLQNKLQKILRAGNEALKPPRKIKPSKWVEENTYFISGPLRGNRTTLFEFQKEPLDTIINPKVRKVVLVSSAQLLKTSTLVNASYYLMANNPANMLHASITGQMLKKFKTGNFEQGIKASPTLQELVTKKTDKTSTNDQYQTECRDGTMIYYASLGAPSQLRSVTAKYLFLDEISGATETDEGDPIALVEQRATTFADSLIMMSSTPVTPDDPVMVEFNKSDQRHFYVPCPHCGEYHTLEWKNVKFDWVIVDNGRRKRADPETAKLHCPHCNHAITDVERNRAVTKGYWKADRPEITDVVGFQISRLYSPLTTIKKIVQDFADAHYNFDLRSFYNLSLGLPYEDEHNKQIDLTLLENQRDYSINIKKIPDDCLGLFVGIDQQLDRLECTTIGITDNEKKIYVLDHRTFSAIDTTKVESPAYKELVQFLKYPFKTMNGKPLRRFAAFIDSGNGNATSTVYRVCGQYRQNDEKILTAVKGSGQPHTELFRKSKTAGKEFILLNVNEGKNYIAKLISQSVSAEHENFANNIYFSGDLPDDYFIQLTSERRVFRGGNYVWEKRTKSNNDRNEMLDTLNYALISVKWVLSRLGAHPFKELRIYNANQLRKVQSEFDNDIDFSNIDTEDTQPQPINTKATTQPINKRRRTSFIAGGRSYKFK
ncbi:terminase [Salmonella enterica]|nr:terminase [Salmonella enterica]EBP4970170.1 terminase [Salmonella enterica]EEE0486811.1 terminase [Salmonella enterica subsp. enterica]EEE2603670.1 terminase [Salmonella enterica subsp. enterica]MID24717.1 terminase [Salmonella enterica]